MPKSLAYTLAKTQVHYLATSLALRDDITIDSDVIGLMPSTLNTEDNRKFFPNADHNKWLQLEPLAGLIKMWADGSNRPSNGSLAIVKNKNGSAVPEFV